MPHYENVPFEVPESWEWCTIGKLFHLQAGKNISASDINYQQTDYYLYPCFGGNGLRGYVHDFNREGYFPLIGRQGALCGNINFANGRFYATEHAVVVETFAKIDITLIGYILRHLNLNQYATATAQPGLSVKTINEVLVPLPPLHEQKRIVAEIEKWFALIDIIEQDQIKLKTVIEQTKSKVLDLAIHGKLVSQDPNDESASELLKRINPKADSTCDNGQYKKLPRNWSLVKGKHLFYPMKSTKPSKEEFMYIDIDSIDNKKQRVKKIKIIRTVDAPSRASRYTQKGDTVFSMVRPYLRNIAKIELDDCIASTGFYVCSPIQKLLFPNYCYYLMISNYVVNGLNKLMKGDNSPSIKKGDIGNWYFPLPPFDEQKRIVNKIEKAFAVLEQIQNSLEA